MTGVSLGFLPKPLMVPIDNILLSRKVLLSVADTKKLQQIRASIEEIDLIAYSTRWRTRFHADGGQRSTVIADTVPR